MIEHLTLLFLDGIFVTTISEPIIAIILVAVGFAIGIAIGMSGIGAPMLFPILILLGMPPQAVVGTNLAFLAFTRIFTATNHAKNHHVDWKALAIMIIPIVPSMFLGKIIWEYVEKTQGSQVLDDMIFLLLGIIFMGLTFYLIKFHVLKKDFEHLDFISRDKSSMDSSHKQSKRNPIIWLITGGPISLIYQISGLGAVSMMLPVLVKTLHSPKIAAGTMALFGVFAAFVGTTLHYSMDTISFESLLFLLAGSIPGSIIGVKLVDKISARKLLFVFSLIIFFSGIFLLGKAIMSL